jgi:hypothetical protein
MSYVNKFRYDVSSPVKEETSSQKILSEEFLIRHYTPQTKFIHEQLLKYFLLGVPCSPSEKTHIHYGKIKKIKKLTTFSFDEQIKIPIANKNENLSVSFLLFRKGSVVPSEVVKKELNVSRHYAAYKTTSAFPRCIATYANGIVDLSISMDDTSNVSQFNVYKKMIFTNGDVSSYAMIASFPPDFHNTHRISLGEGLYSLRVIPVDLAGNETGCYENVIVGNSHDSIGSISILPYYSPTGDKITFDIFNIPVGTTKLFLYRRDCTQNPYEAYELAAEIQGFHEVENYKIVDPKEVKPGNIFEYYVSAMTSIDRVDSKKFVSNYCMIRHPIPTLKKAIKVRLENFRAASDTVTNEFSVSFDLSSEVSQEEKEVITKALRDQLGEMYSLYLDPANNASSPLGDGKYADLIMHEVVRTNLNTSERVVFRLSTNGKFIDNMNTQAIVRANPVNPRHSYAYQVFSYKKNPILLFKDYVAYGIDVKGKEWFYSPYKWKQPKVISTGKLYPDGLDGKPIIDSYEALTSEPLGLTATKIYSGAEPISLIKDVLVERVDRNTTMLRWNTSSSNILTKIQAKIDGFIVLKVVNGIRKFVGKTTQNFLYHELTEEDFGTIYYIVLPIEDNFNIAQPEYSNEIFIDSKGISIDHVTNAGASNV